MSIATAPSIKNAKCLNIFTSSNWSEVCTSEKFYLLKGANKLINQKINYININIFYIKMQIYTLSKKIQILHENKILNRIIIGRGSKMNYKIEELVEEYSNMVMQIAYQNSFNKSDAEDITQEVFIKLINNLEKLETKEHIKAWIIRVTINLVKDYNKSFWRKNTCEMNEELNCFDDEIKEVLNELVKLKPVYRNIIYLYYYQQYKINEIADLLKMNVNTVSSSLTRARKQLKDILEEEVCE